MRLSHHAPDRAGPCLHMLESYGCPWLRSKQTHVGRGMYRDLLRSLFWYAACVFGNTARSQSAAAGHWPLISSTIIVPLTCPLASGASLPSYNTSRFTSMILACVDVSTSACVYTCLLPMVSMYCGKHTWRVFAGSGSATMGLPISSTSAGFKIAEVPSQEHRCAFRALEDG